MKHTFTPYQKLVVAILGFLQFTIILDFMVLSPLGAILMPELQITPSQFGFVVSIYAFSAGIAGLLAAGFADKFDRKKLLLFFYTGFIGGTVLCALAPTYHFLLAARMITGIFGGVIGSIVFAITTDLFPFEMRGRVIGVIQTAFAASQVLGLPFAFYLANHFGWHSAFSLIAVVAALVGIIIVTKLQPINAHLKLQSNKNAFQHLIGTLFNARYLQAFITIALLSTGGYMLMPFGSAFNVHNVGIPIEKIPLIYLITGLSTIFAAPMVGRACDRFGKYNVFLIGSLLSMMMIFIYTHLGIEPIGVVIVINIIMFVGITSRMIGSQALMSAIPTPDSRGAFMSVSSSIQQIAGGFASVLAGLIVAENSDHTLAHFDRLGFVVIGAVITTIILMYFIHRRLGPESKLKGGALKEPQPH